MKGCSRGLSELSVLLAYFTPCLKYCHVRPAQNKLTTWQWILTTRSTLKFPLNFMGVILYLFRATQLKWDEWWRNWLSHCVTRREVPGSIPGQILRKFQVTYFFSVRTQKPWGYSAAGAYSWQLCHPSSGEYQSKGGSSTFHPPSESSWLVNGKALPFTQLKYVSRQDNSSLET